MQVEKLSPSRLRYTIGDRTIFIEKGGEDIPNNTYGFEIEFCTHDSSVFTFTHVDALQCGFAPLGLTPLQVEALVTGTGEALSTIPQPNSPAWKIESDSGNVLELVTPPLHFPSVSDAQVFRTELAGILRARFQDAPLPEDQGRPIKAFLLGEWLGRVREPLQTLMKKSLPNAGLLQFHARVAPWVEVGRQLNQENVDDGINIPAARMRHALNQHDWDNYVGSTVLSRSEKDWGAGYSSQLNMPMSLAGYFLYARQKYEKSWRRFRALESWFGDPDGAHAAAESSDTALRKNVTTWFWRSILWSALDAYVRLLKPGSTGVDWTPTNVQSWDIQMVTRLAFLYLMGSKILTGAMGSLSEPDQLKMQEYAWFSNSTAVMATDGPAEERVLREAMSKFLNAPLELKRDWLEYHSAMKDLTGLWFKASLFDVILCENMNPLFLTGVGEMLRQPNQSVWPAIIHRYLRFVKSDNWNRAMDKVRPGYVDDLEELDEASLITAIQRVEIDLGKALCDVDGWKKLAMNPDRATRKFLHYAEAPPWEGRYDTMYKPIAPNPQKLGDPWTYLVEHRFN
jgi:hypothetical protein